MLDFRNLLSFLNRGNSLEEYSKLTKVLFHREFVKFQGGHLKVWNYYNYLKFHPQYSPFIYFTDHSIMNETNPWFREVIEKAWDPSAVDMLFLGGVDWHAVLNNAGFLKNRNNIPIINLIQHVNHANPSDVKYNFLSQRAIRICVSAEVSDAVSSTGKANGPIFTIPNGVDLESFEKKIPDAQKKIDILILAIKNPELGLELEKDILNMLNLSNFNILTIINLMPRAKFLSLVIESKICVFLPNYTEGFYLPALEAMALESLVVCPDCIGNRSFCLDQVNCLRPGYDKQSILDAVYKGIMMSSSDRQGIILNAKKIAEKHSLASERESFYSILDNIKNIW